MADITRVGKRPKWDSYAFSDIFGGLYREHGDIRYSTDKPSQELTDSIKIAPGYAAFVSYLMSSIRISFRERVGDIQAMDSGFSQSKVDRMYACKPPLVKYDPEPKLMVCCREYAICPFCRYRKQGMIHGSLGLNLPKANYIGVLQLVVPPQGGLLLPDHVGHLVPMLDTIYNKKWNYWEYDNVVACPRLMINDDGSQTWVATAAIIAMSTDRDAFWNPLEKLGVDYKWRILPATPHHLSAAIAETMRYPSEMLLDSSIRDLAYVRRAFIGENGPVCRSRSHGVRHGEQVNYRRIEENYNIEYQKFCVHGRPAFAPANLAESYWDSRRCIPRITADHRLLLKASA